MAEHDDRLSSALHGMRGSLRQELPTPAPGAVRGRAERRIRIGRAASTVAAAVAVTVIVLAASQLARPTTGPPVAPADSPSSSHSTGVPTPTGVTPSPRAAPHSPEPLEDPITEVDWRSAEFTVPSQEGCPEGSVRLAPLAEDDPVGAGPDDTYPRISVDGTNAAYGDLTGDGRAEAVVAATCFPSEEASSGHGSRLLVLARTDSGALAGLGWAGPPNAFVTSYWVAEGQLLLDAVPATTEAESSFPAVPGLALRYRWDGGGWDGWDRAPAYPPLAPLAEGGPRPPVRLRAVAAGLSCPDESLRFVAEPSGGVWTASVSGALYAVGAPSYQQHLFDLDNTGRRLLVTALECARDDGSRTRGLAVLEPAGSGWQGISVLRHPDDLEPVGWWRTPAGDLAVDWSDGNVGTVAEYRWTGTVLQPSGG